MRLTKTYADGTYGVADDLPCGENSHDFKKLLIDTLGALEDSPAERRCRELDDECERIGRDKARIANEKANLVLKLKQAEALLTKEREANKKLHEGLEWYASFWNHDVQLEDIGITSMQRDRGERARSILEGNEPNEGNNIRTKD